MRSFIVGVVLILLPLALSWGAAQDYTGDLIFKDGTKTTFTRLRLLVSEAKEDIIPYSKDLTEMKGTTGDLSSMRLSGVSRIDFIDLTDAEKKTMKKAAIPAAIRKGKITFRDGAVYDNVYLDCRHGNWGSERESGWLGSDKIRSVTVKLKGAKLCPKCGRHFKEIGWKYCPFCGMALK